MTTRLTDTERTLLSAHCDGELDGSEQDVVERLLAGSEEARDYVRDLRSLTEFSQTAFPAAPAIGAGVGFGSKLTSGAIQTAARTASTSSFGIGWGVAGLAAAAVTTVAVLTTMLGGDDAPVSSRPPRTIASAPARRTDVARAGLDLSSSALMVPAITSEELIDFAVSGRLPIDSTRTCYVSVAPRQGALSINMHASAGTVPTRLSGFDLRAVPGIDSLERAIRTSLLQSDDNGLAVSFDLPSLRLRVLEELQEAAEDLPAEFRRSMDDTRLALEREYLSLSTELRRSQLDARRGSDASTRYVVIAGSDLPRPTAFGAPTTFTVTTNDRRVRTLELTSSEIGTLGAFVGSQLAETPVAETARAGSPRDGSLDRSAPVRYRSATPAARVFIRRHGGASRTAASARPTLLPDLADSTISFEQLQILRERGQTLDGIFIDSEQLIQRATIILQRADSIRRHIEIIRMQQDANGADDGTGDDLETPPADDQPEAKPD